MLSSPRKPEPRWQLPCPREGCAYYIDSASDSGAGKAVARMTDEHMREVHNGRSPAWLEEAVEASDD